MRLPLIDLIASVVYKKKKVVFELSAYDSERVMGKRSSPQWGAPIGFEFGINRVRLPLSSAKKPLQAQLEGAEVQREDAHSYSS
jgi:hypothetical protein